MHSFPNLYKNKYLTKCNGHNWSHRDMHGPVTKLKHGSLQNFTSMTSAKTFDEAPTCSERSSPWTTRGHLVWTNIQTPALPFRLWSCPSSIYLKSHSMAELQVSEEGLSRTGPEPRLEARQRKTFQCLLLRPECCGQLRGLLDMFLWGCTVLFLIFGKCKTE